VLDTLLHARNNSGRKPAIRPSTVNPSVLAAISAKFWTESKQLPLQNVLLSESPAWDHSNPPGEYFEKSLR
jgi:hypothetical protein